MIRLALALAFVAVAAAFPATASAGGGGHVPVPDFALPGGSSTFLPHCAALSGTKRSSCYVRELLKMVDTSGDPARELPRIDERVHAAGGYVEAWCHMFMHEVGRVWARRHGVTIANMFKYVPKSNDPGCSAGFGMGLVMHVGPKLITRPRSVLGTCSRLPTRFRRYSCVHGAGHAFMRGLHGDVPKSVAACETLGALAAPDCAQGVYHDYWISLGGGDGTTRPKGAVADPRVFCGSARYPIPCWYRYFLEREPGLAVEGGRDLPPLCRGLSALQRAGCVAGASLTIAGRRDPVDHARTCRQLSGRDVVNCLRGVNVPAVAAAEWRQLDLIRTCTPLERVTRYACYVWFGRTLSIATDGRFGRSGCAKLQLAVARTACVAGARLAHQPLRTFA